MSEEKLRTALQKIQGVAGNPRGELLGEIVFIRQIADAALSEAGEPEMVRLLHDLDARVKALATAEAVGGAQKRWSHALYCKTRNAAVKGIIEHIEREFGYSLPQGEE